jgi:hypothetical protein
MFKLPSQIPTIEDSVETLTDYLEFECIKEGRLSVLTKIKKLLLSNDEILIEGTEDESDEALAKIEEISQEIQRRQADSSGKYPFLLQNNGYTLVIVQDAACYWVYVYLLLSTRLNMKSSRTHNEIDGTQLLEHLSASVAKNHFGHRSQSWVFGTATKGNFQEKVNLLCKKIGEGKHFDNHGNMRVEQNDDKLDIVVWIDFQDKLSSKFTAFGQCKTGTTFDDKETIELQPSDFCKKWFRSMPVVDPVKLFFCSQSFPPSYSKLVNAGIVFDRTRIMDCLPSELDSELHQQMQNWCEGALNFLTTSQ